MSDSEDSNFSEEEDSERSSDGEEAEVCGWDMVGRHSAWGQDQGRKAPVGAQRRSERALASGSFQAVGSDREVGKPKSSRGTGAGGPGGPRYSEVTGDVYKEPGI